MLSVINVTLPHLNQPVNEMQFVGIAPFLGLCLTTVMILSQVIRISSSLGGGIAIAGLSTGAAIASTAWNKSGASKLANNIGNYAVQKFNSTYRHRGAP